MKRDIISSLLGIVAMTVILGIAYPLVITGAAQVAFRDRADGSQITLTGSQVIEMQPHTVLRFGAGRNNATNVVVELGAIDVVNGARAGLEIGVAATKTFVSQVAVMYLLGLKLAQVRGTMSPERAAELAQEVKRLPHLISELLERIDEPVREIAKRWSGADFFLYLGRHVGLPVCLEGALKLKEISYIPTDAYAAGEMKHGPIALLDEQTPVVCVATDSPVLDKVLSNVAEVRARGAHVIAVATDGNPEVALHAEEVVTVPRTDWLLQPILAVIPLQLLAYHIARARGLNVDQPRNLAKTVTVE